MTCQATRTPLTHALFLLPSFILTFFLLFLSLLSPFLQREGDPEGQRHTTKVTWRWRLTLELGLHEGSPTKPGQPRPGPRSASCTERTQTCDIKPCDGGPGNRSQRPLQGEQPAGTGSAVVGEDRVDAGGRCPGHQGAVWFQVPVMLWGNAHPRPAAVPGTSPIQSPQVV